MTTLGYIILANLVSTLLSIGLAAWLSFRYLAKVIDRLVPVSAGLLLATAVTHLLPEAFHSEADPQVLGWVLLAGILGLFLLEKLALIHHTHHHEGDLHHHAHGHDKHEAGRGGLPILIGDAFHNFADGVVIAGAFLVDVQLGFIATLAVMAHEIPHEVGDFMILLNAGFTRRRAFVFNLVSGLSAVLGGLIGYFVLDADAVAAAVCAGDRCRELHLHRAVGPAAGNDASFVTGEVAARSGTGAARRGHRGAGNRFLPRPLIGPRRTRTGTAQPASGLRRRWLRLCAGADRARRVGDPLAPRSRVERRARQAGHFHRQHVMARGDAGAALVRDRVGGRGRPAASRNRAAAPPVS